LFDVGDDDFPEIDTDALGGKLFIAADGGYIADNAIGQFIFHKFDFFVTAGAMDRDDDFIEMGSGAAGLLQLGGTAVDLLGERKRFDLYVKPFLLDTQGNVLVGRNNTGHIRGHGPLLHECAGMPR
jgi:hypothetical protein